MAEFAEHGIAGARTDAIAQAAHVNKALLYYYFKDKDALYEAVLDHVFSGLRARVMPVLESKLPPRRKMLDYLGAYFDYIAANPRFPRVVQGEWMRSGAGSARMQRVAKEYFRPIFGKVAALLREGIAAGEFRAVNPMDFVSSVVGVIIFYFSAAPLMKTLTKSRSVVGGADSGAAGVCAGVYFGGAVSVITATELSVIGFQLSVKA